MRTMTKERMEAFLSLYGWEKLASDKWDKPEAKGTPRIRPSAVRIQREANCSSVLSMLGWEVKGGYYDGFIVMNRSQHASKKLWCPGHRGASSSW